MNKMNKMLTGTLRLIATPYANSTFLIYDEKVTLRKRNSVLRHFAANETSNSPVFASSRSSEMSICPSLVALMALSFSTQLMKIVCFCSTGLYPFLL